MEIEEYVEDMSKMIEDKLSISMNDISELGTAVEISETTMAMVTY